MVKVVAFSSTVAYAGGNSGGGDAGTMVGVGSGSTAGCSATAGSEGGCGIVVGGGATTASSYEGIGALMFGRDMAAKT